MGARDDARKRREAALLRKPGVTRQVAILDAGNSYGEPVPSATVLPLGATTGGTVLVTGTTPITSISEAPAGVVRKLVFNDATTITHDNAALILPNSVDIKTVAGDTAEVVSLGSGNWRMHNYVRGSGGAFGSYQGTSITNVAMGYGTKGFVTQTNLAYSVGVRVRVTSASGDATWMEGAVVSYSGIVLVIYVDLLSTVGPTHNDWILNLGSASFTPGSNSPIVSSRLRWLDYLQGSIANVASAATLFTAGFIGNGVVVNVTGSVTITEIGEPDFDLGNPLALRVLVFSGSLTLTHDATKLILPTGANIQTAAGDVAEVRCILASSPFQWRCTSYTRADGTALVPASGAAGGDLTGTYPNPTVNSNKITDAKLRTGGACTVIGRSANSSGNVADISLADGDFLGRRSGVVGGGPLSAADVVPAIYGPGGVVNATLAASVGSNALTITLKTYAAGTPSATDPVRVLFRSPTAGTGTHVERTVTAANTLVISSGSTMGFASAVAGRLWIVLFDDGGTIRLGAVNCLASAAGGGAGRTVSSIYPLRDDILASATSEGGAGTADSAQVIYSSAAVTSKAMRILGYMDWSSGLTTAGTWDAVPTLIQLFGHGVTLPGQPVQYARGIITNAPTGTTTVPDDNTIPQKTEGDQYITQAITPIAAPNALKIDVQINMANNAAGAITLCAALFQDSTSNALKAIQANQAAASSATNIAYDYWMLASTTSSTTLALRAGGSAAGTTTVNGRAAAGKMGGVCESVLAVTEIMG